MLLFFDALRCFLKWRFIGRRLRFRLSVHSFCLATVPAMVDRVLGRQVLLRRCEINPFPVANQFLTFDDQYAP